MTNEMRLAVLAKMVQQITGIHEKMKTGELSNASAATLRDVAAQRETLEWAHLCCTELMATEADVANILKDGYNEFSNGLRTLEKKQ